MDGLSRQRSVFGGTEYPQISGGTKPIEPDRSELALWRFRSQGRSSNTLTPKRRGLHYLRQTYLTYGIYLKTCAELRHL